MSVDEPKDEIIDVEPQVIEDTQSTLAAKRPFGARRIAGLCMGALVLGALGGGWLYRDYFANYLPSDQLQAVEAKVDALETASKDSQKRADAFVALTEELKAQLGAAQSAAEKNGKENADTAAQAQANAQTIGDVKQSLDQTAKAVDDLKAQVASGGVSNGGNVSVDPTLVARVDQLEKDVAALKSAPVKVAGFDVTAVQPAFVALKSKIDQGAGYGPEFANLQALVPMAAGMDVIGAESEKGLPNAQQLASQLSALMPQLPKSVTSAAPDNSWSGWIEGAVSNLVSVKVIGQDDVSAVAAQALGALQNGDLQKASDALATSSGPLPDALQTWAGTLQRRLKLEQAVAALNAGLSRLAQVKG